MKVDPLDKMLVCGAGDVENKLRLHQEDCVLPAEIELDLLKITCEAASIEPYIGDSATEACEHLPKRLLDRFVAQINGFFTNSEVDYADKHLSYLLYYFPANVYKIWKPLSDLLVGNLLKHSLRILDVGTGPGSVPVGIVEFYRRLAESFPEIDFSLGFVLLDRQMEFLAFAEKTVAAACEQLPRNLRVSVRESLHQQIAAEDCSLLPKGFDIITLSNVLTPNEGGDGTAAERLMRALAGCLANDGAIILIEPGDGFNGANLKELRNRLVNAQALHLYAPCVDIWGEGRPYDCACFNPTRCYWSLPEIHRFLLSRGVRRSSRTNVPFHYAVFRNDAASKYTGRPSQRHYVKLRDLVEHDGDVVNVVAMVRNVFETEKHIELHLCDGTNRNGGWSPEVRLFVPRESLRKMGLQIRFLAAERITLKGARVCVGRNVELHPTDKMTVSIDY